MEYTDNNFLKMKRKWVVNVITDHIGMTSHVITIDVENDMTSMSMTISSCDKYSKIFKSTCLFQ